MNYILVDEGVPLVAGNIVLEIYRKTLEKPEIYLGLETEVRISEQMPVGENTGVDVPDQLQDGFVKRELPAGEYIICRVEAEKYYRDFEGMACMEIWVKPLPLKNKG